MPQPGATHVVSAVASAPNHRPFEAHAFLVVRSDANCRPADGVVTTANGNVIIRRFDQASTDTPQYAIPATRLSEGAVIQTGGADRVVVRFGRVDGTGATLVVSVNANTSVKVLHYCIDQAGVVQLQLGLVPNPGATAQIRVDARVPNQPSATVPSTYRVQIVTNGVKLNDVHTSYIVTADPIETDVAVFDGSVQLQRPDQTTSVVTAGNAAAIPNEPTAAITTGAITGQPDPDLTQLAQQALPQDTTNATPTPAAPARHGSSNTGWIVLVAGAAIVAAAVIWRRHRPAPQTAPPGAAGDFAPTQPATPMTGWTPTHRAPPGGMPVWSTPDNTQPPIAQLDANLAVAIRQHWGDWAEIACDNNWTGWVDSRQLIPGP